MDSAPWLYRLVYWTDLYQAGAKQAGPGGGQPGLFRSKLTNTNIAAPDPAAGSLPGPGQSRDGATRRDTRVMREGRVAE